MACHIGKRPRHEPSPWAEVTYLADTESPPHEFEDILGENPIYAVQDSFTAGIHRISSELQHTLVEKSRKRGSQGCLYRFNNLLIMLIFLGHSQVDDQSGYAADENEFLSLEARQWLRESFPELEPTIPSFDDRSVILNIPVPFAKDGEARHPKLREKKSAMSVDGAVNGLLKFHIGSSDGNDKSSVDAPFARRQMAVHHRAYPTFRQNEGVPPLPPGFGRDGKLKLDQTDTRLLRFCKLF
jgi:hypothetical protein